MIAERLLRQREAVTARLRRLGAQIVDAPGRGPGDGAAQRLSRRQAAGPASDGRAAAQEPALPRRARGRLAPAGDPARPRPRRGGAAQAAARRAAGDPAALPPGAVVAVGGALDLAGPEPDRLSREPVHAGLFLRLRRAHAGCRSGWPASSCATGRRRCRRCGARPWSPSCCRRWATVVAYRPGAARPRLVLQLRRPAALASRPRSRRRPPPRCARRSTTTPIGERGPVSVFATFLFTHNAQIALFAFALGFALCLPTAALLVMNGGDAGRLPGAVRLARPGLRGRRLADDPRRDRAVRHRRWPARRASRIGWAVAFPGERTPRRRRRRGRAARRPRSWSAWW